MKFLCTQDYFRQALSLIERAVAKNTTLPIVRNVLCRTDRSRGVIECCATNLDYGITTTFPAKIEEDGAFVFMPRTMNSILANSSSGAMISCVQQDNGVCLTIGSVVTTLPLFDVADFPVMPFTHRTHPTAVFPASRFSESIARVGVAVAPTNVRPELSGIYLLYTQTRGGWDCAATDSYRLMEALLPVQEGDAMDGQNVIIPTPIIHDVARAANTLAVPTIAMTLEDGQVFFRVGETLIVSRCISGSYPDYKQIMPSDFSVKIALSRDDLVRTLRTASVFAPQKTGEIRCIFGQKTLSITARSSEQGEYTATLTPMIAVGEECAVALNVRYLLDAVSGLTAPHIVVCLNDAASPVALYRAHSLDREIAVDKNDVAIIMPIRA